MQLTTNSTPILTQAETVELLVKPFLQQSIAARVLHTVRITSGTYRVPTIAKEVEARWTREAEEIVPSDMQFGEMEVHPSKVAGLVVVSRELAHDSSPAATDAVGASLVRQLVKATDEAVFKSLPDLAPKGLTSLTGTSAVALPFTNVDLQRGHRGGRAVERPALRLRRRSGRGPEARDREESGREQ